MLYVYGVRKSGKLQCCMFTVFVNQVNHNGVCLRCS